LSVLYLAQPSTRKISLVKEDLKHTKMRFRALVYVLILSFAAFALRTSGLSDAERQALIEHFEIDVPVLHAEINEPLTSSPIKV
jgi:hypothetical protein